MAKISWTNSSGGSWTLGSNWSSGTIPGANDSVTIAIAPGQGLSSYTVDVATDVVVKSVALDQAAATLQVGDGSGDGTLATHLKLQAGTLDLNGGTLSGLVAETGGVLQIDESGFYYAEGAFDNVTWQGDLAPTFNPDRNEGTISVFGSLTLTGAGGKGPGTLTLNQSGLGMYFVDTQTLDNATVELGNQANADPAVVMAVTSDGNGAADLTFGANLVLNTTGIAQLVDDGQLTNNGTISTFGTSNLTLVSYEFQTGTFTNAGTMAVNANGFASVELPEFTNTGNIMIAQGGTLDLAFSTYELSNFVNSGTLLDDGVVQLDGSLTTAQVQAFNISYGGSGALQISNGSTLDNTGATLSLGSGGIAPNVNLAGTIINGTITENGGTLAGQGGTLSGVTLNGPLSLTGTYSALTVENGLQLQPDVAVNITGQGASLTFDGTSQTLDQAVIQMGSSEGDTLAAFGGTLTLGSTVRLNVSSGSATLGTYYPGTVLNQGNISVAAGATLFTGSFFGEGSVINAGSISVSSGGTLYIDNDFANNGTVSIDDGDLLVGNVTAAALNSIKLTDSFVGIVGGLDATGSTIDVGVGTNLGDVSIGLTYPGDESGASITGGTIHDGGGGLQFLGTVALNDLTYQGVLSITAPYAEVVINTITLENEGGSGPGTLVLSGPQSVLDVAFNATLDNATIDIGSPIDRQGQTQLDMPRIEGGPGSGGAAPLGAHLVIDQINKYGGIGENSAFNNSLTSSATINAGFKGGQFVLDGGQFNNDGTVNISGQDNLTSAAAYLVNNGTFSVGSGGTLSLNLLKYYQAAPISGTSFENAGVVVLAGGTITEQTGKGIPPVPLRNDASGVINGAGVIAAEIANYGTITAVGGALTLSQAVSGGGGVLDIAASSTLSLLASVSAGETAQFGGADGVLGLSAKQFLGEIGGFAKGDTIDLFKLNAKTASFVGSSIAVTLSNGSTISLALTAPGSGSLSVTGDGNGGSLIAFAGAAAHAAEVPLVPSAPAPAWVQPETVMDKMSYWESLSHHFGH